MYIVILVAAVVIGAGLYGLGRGLQAIAAVIQTNLAVPELRELVAKQVQALFLQNDKMVVVFKKDIAAMLNHQGLQETEHWRSLAALLKHLDLVPVWSETRDLAFRKLKKGERFPVLAEGWQRTLSHIGGTD